MPPGGILGQHNKSQGQYTFVPWKLEQYSQSTSILPLPVCAELTLEMEFFLWWKALLFLSETWVMKGFMLYHRKLLKIMKLTSIKELYSVWTHFLPALWATDYPCWKQSSSPKATVPLWEVTRLSSYGKSDQGQTYTLAKPREVFWCILKVVNQWLNARQRSALVLSLLLAVLLSESCCWGKCSSACEASMCQLRGSHWWVMAYFERIGGKKQEAAMWQFSRTASWRIKQARLTLPSSPPTALSKSLISSSCTFSTQAWLPMTVSPLCSLNNCPFNAPRICVMGAGEGKGHLTETAMSVHPWGKINK